MSAIGRYLHIRAWGHMMGSFAPYVKEQVERAAADGAPDDVIYVVHQYDDGHTDYDTSDPARYFHAKSGRIWARYGADAPHEGLPAHTVSAMETYLANLRDHNTVFAAR